MGCWFNRHKWEEVQSLEVMDNENKPTGHVLATTYVCKKCLSVETVKFPRR